MAEPTPAPGPEADGEESGPPGGSTNQGGPSDQGGSAERGGSGERADSGERPSAGTEDRPEPPAPAGQPAGSARSQSADDAAFLDLVARFDEEPDARRWPAAEDLSDPHRPTVIILRPATDPGGPTAPDDRTDPGLGATGPRNRRDPAAPGPGGVDDDMEIIEFGELPEPDDHYEPPSPPPLPRIRPTTRWALGSIALGVVFLVVPGLIGFNQSRGQDVTGVLLILGGVGTLVARMGDRPPTDSDGPDDGAVI